MLLVCLMPRSNFTPDIQQTPYETFGVYTKTSVKQSRHLKFCEGVGILSQLSYEHARHLDIDVYDLFTDVLLHNCFTRCNM